MVSSICCVLCALVAIRVAFVIPSEREYTVKAFVLAKNKKQADSLSGQEKSDNILTAGMGFASVPGPLLGNLGHLGHLGHLPRLHALTTGGNGAASKAPGDGNNRLGSSKAVSYTLVWILPI